MTPVVTASRGKVDNAYVVKVVGTDRWRASFDLQVEGNRPVDLRLFLRWTTRPSAKPGSTNIFLMTRDFAA